ncbi:hypothetical protein [Adhaeretor mobilis]|uniref:DUF5681 domain-containing protein n=1 Tax=Adhaeretor mobilis TaxID=1930276 RepID=A0A517MSC2_9BACT|nr:hypothetical protein [Adhaeretor mobilis]QDS97687.1 hypothetical protein HG15A2_09510 [Adhaeretor mobilis]
MARDRSNNGRFLKGNPGGPGRPRRAVEADYLAAITNRVTLEDWQEVVGRAIEDAKKGDARARDWLSRYLVGVDPPESEDQQEPLRTVIINCPDNGRGPKRDADGNVIPHTPGV